MKKLFPFLFLIIPSAICAQSWLITGNSGLTNSNFLGTIDNKDIIFKTNSIARGRLTGAGNWRLGSTVNNMLIDSNGVLSFSGKGVYKVNGNKYAFQYSQNPNYGLFFNESDTSYEFRNGNAIPVFNINANSGNASVNGTLTVGAYTFPFPDGLNGQVLATNGAGLLDWTTPFNGKAINVVLGSNAFQSNISGYSNIVIGAGALNKTTAANNIIAIGDSALYKQNTTSKNMAVGSKALYSNLAGANNTAIGFQTLNKNTSGNDNTAIGNLALYSNLVGSSNTAIGSLALYNGIQGVNNTAIGNGALYGDAYGDANTATGFQSLYNNSTGSKNCAFGYQSIYGNSGGSNNTAIGYQALNKLSFSDNNTAIGFQALFSNYNGSDNTATGNSALYYNNGGQDNTANGTYALMHNGAGTANSAMGKEALDQNTLGNYNTAMGFQALYSNVNGSYNTAIGTYANVSNTSLTNASAFGYNAIANANNKVVIGNTDVTVIGGQVGWSTFSDGRFKTNIKSNVPGLAFINNLKPVTYQAEITRYEKFLGVPDSVIDLQKNKLATDEQKIHTGFIAQDVEKTAKEIHYDFDGVNHPQNEKDNYSLVYADFVPSLVKAVQELSKMNDNKDSALTKMTTEIENLKSEMNELKAMILSGNQSQNSNLQMLLSASSKASLSQNIPNPFNHTATINYTLPPQYTSAKIVITDKNGAVLKQINISGPGNGSLTFDASGLTSGVYQYSLYINDKLIDAKQMILTK